jgi:ABC-type amino acid transport substrate-binding protein
MRAAIALATVLLLTGCGAQIPADPDGTLERTTGGTLRVGVTPHDTFTVVEAGQVSGSEAELVEAFAASIDADVAWTVASEEALVRELENGALDVVIGGITDQTPWIDKAGMTRPYDEFTDARGERHKLVMLVPLGENGFLVELERFLSEAVPS